MNRLAVVLLAIGLLVATGCGGPTPGATGGEISGYAEVTVDPQVILERDGLAVTALSLALSGVWGPRLKILVENSGNRSVILEVRDLAINDVVVDDLFYCEVEAGKRVNDEIIFIATDLEAAGIEVIQKIEFTFHVCDAGTWDTLFDSGMITLTTSADPSFEQPYDDSGYPALEQGGFRAVINYYESEECPWGADICVYMENNNDIDVIFQAKEILVNGSAVEPIFLAEVPAGKIAYDMIIFLKSDLADCHIESVDELKISFHIIDRDSGNTILESGLSTIVFGEGK